ncbi:DLIC-domain-containing protein [Stereum hirsutum FP-91666 SS1]|uniref:DLIC-domain-containing protein n=1 Tax=Stereum hirsutum (strain FP-91666) TaxID=721885 RepID=UPI000440F33D|nr:DLIC-domain-containing protein [Stereum hirsutum FP-91666 SS1]EIM87879.1 DLIC-domain-containing protein [Stereum hirsutum FP-91666 SS1]
MDGPSSRPGSPSDDAPPENLWSSILDSVSSTRAIPSKQILILGQPQTGKSTLSAALLQKAPADVAGPGNNEVPQSVDFALGYDWADVRDEADEGAFVLFHTLARLSVYNVPSSAPAYTSLLPHFLPARTSLPHTLVMIVLDWTRPWTFVDELFTWLTWIEDWVKGETPRELVIAREENRERLQAYLQHYTEPSSEPIPASSASQAAILPLGPGIYTHNTAGVPIIVTCTKSDLIDDNHNDVVGAGASGMGGMVKGKGGEWEERTDGVMQILRTVCLKYGASLFYTTQQPSTLQILRQYALHLLFIPPAPSPGLSTGTDAPAPVRNPFPFTQKPNTLDRDRIVVPAGWDSWGKIAVLREGFDAKGWGEAWERDLESANEDENAVGDDEVGARKMYSQLVPDQGYKPPPLPPFNNPIPEQTFLAKNYDENSKKPDRDPRGMFRNPTESTAGANAGIVGPLSSSSFSMPNVERALTEMEASSAFTPTGPMSAGGINLVGPDSPGTPLGRKGSGRNPTRAPNAGNASAAGPGARSDLSSSVMGSSPGSGGQTQHEVLQNFFQSLLSSKDRPGSAAAARTGGKLSTGPSGNTARVTSEDKGGANGGGSGGGSGGAGAGSNRSSMVGPPASGTGGGSGSGTEDGA